MVICSANKGGEHMADRVASILKERRKEMELTQSEVAHEVGIDLQSYQKFESGKRKLENCSMRIGLQVCAALELDPYELLFFYRK